MTKRNGISEWAERHPYWFWGGAALVAVSAYQYRQGQIHEDPTPRGTVVPPPRDDRDDTRGVSCERYGGFTLCVWRKDLISGVVYQWSLDQAPGGRPISTAYKVGLAWETHQKALKEGRAFLDETGGEGYA